MWISDRWKDYALIDCSDGERLERWGDKLFIRPDPQVIWQTARTHPGWQVYENRYVRSSSGGGSWERNVKSARWPLSYGALNFRVGPMNFKHMGLFPEQAVNWLWLQEKIKTHGKKPFNVLNLFAYTGGATVACLKAGAHVTHIDAAKGMNRTAKDNITLSGLDHIPNRVLADDVLKFVQREARRGNQYHGIIMDPPVFGRGPSGEMWKLEEKLYELAKACTKIFDPDPAFLLINAYTAGFSPAAYGNILKLVMPNVGVITTHEIGLAAKSGVILPCGMYARWENT